MAAAAQAVHCPACGAVINLHDVEITGHSTAVVQTHGTVHVGRDGFLNSTRVTCGNAFVEGRIAGKITCSGTLRLKGDGPCRAQIRARRLLIDRGTNLRFPYTISADEIVIRGRIAADIHCAGALHVGRHGGLEGDVQSRAMVVDKGGSYAGAVEISPGIARPAPAAPERPDVKVIPGWQARLAFG
ncbi:MAG: polymer-forming cytoskeletal protein [Terrimicrobiaceae bacterium]|nr:polymer-forming cytoskeletal protein [Terrimicrobiaceae bacterium]